MGKNWGLLLNQLFGALSPPRSPPFLCLRCHRCPVTTHKILKDHFCFLILCLKFFKNFMFFVSGGGLICYGEIGLGLGV